jgi:hypothetical protein
MNKSRTGSHILAGLVLLQTGSIPQALDSPPMLTLATYALLCYIALASLLFWHAARNPQPLWFRPRFWTYANLLTFVLLAASTGAAWQAGYGQFWIIAAAVALVGSLAHLYRRNIRRWNRIRELQPPE